MLSYEERKLHYDINILCVKESLCRRFLFSFVHAKLTTWKQIFGKKSIASVSSWQIELAQNFRVCSDVVGESLRCLADRSERLSWVCQQSLRCALKEEILYYKTETASRGNVINFSCSLNPIYILTFLLQPKQSLRHSAKEAMARQSSSSREEESQPFFFN